MSLRRILLSILLLAGCAVLFPDRLAAQRTASIPSNSALDQLLASKESGLLTDWRVVGPFGKSADLLKAYPPESDQLRKLHYEHRQVWNLQFATGKFELPARFPRHGVFYASSEVWLPNGGDWRVYAETAGSMVVFVDGRRLMQPSGDKESLQTTSEVLHLEHGTHRILVKFAAESAPFHVAVMPQTGGLRKRNNKPNLHVTAEQEYTSAELRWERP